MVKTLEFIAYGMAMASIYMVFRGVVLFARADAMNILYNEVPKPLILLADIIVPILSLGAFLWSLYALYSAQTALFVALFCLGVLLALFAQLQAWDMKRFVDGNERSSFDG